MSSKDAAVTEAIKKRLSAIQDKEIVIEDRDSFSEDGKYGDFVQKQNREILKKVQELMFDGQSGDNQQDEQSFVIMNDNQKLEILEDLEEEYGASYQETKVKVNTYIKLIPKNDLQLAYLYTDKYPFLEIRKKVLIFMKLISSWAQMITTHSTFELLTLLVIVFNSAMLALDDPTTNDQNAFQDATDIFFLAYYSFEAFLKIVALGFIFPKKAYLKDTWNILDFCVIVTAYIPYFMASNSVNLNALRSFRVLRPLRTVSSIKALRTILLALFASLAQLRDAVVVLIFFYSIFAIAGVQLFSGYLKRRCIGELSGIELITDETRFCSDDNNCPFPDENIFQENFICGKQIANPQDNLISFDTFGYSFLQVFIVTTQEGWTQIQEAVILTFSQYVIVYFYVVVLVGSFFLVNLTLAIIKLNFKPEKIQEELAQIKQEIEEYDYRQLRQLKLYIPVRQECDTTGYGINWEKKHEIDQNLIFNHRKHQRGGRGSQSNVLRNSQIQRARGKNKVSFQPIKQAVYYSNPILINKNKIKIEGIFGMGNQSKLNQQQNLGAYPATTNNNNRSSVVRRSSQSSNNDDKTSSKKVDTYVNETESINKVTRAPRKSIQMPMGFEQQISSEFLNSPMMDLQTENIRPLNGGTMLVHHRGSMDSSKSGGSRNGKTPNNQLEIPRLGEIKQQSQSIRGNQKFSIAAGMKFQKPPRASPKPESQKSLEDNEFDSVNLSELNTISDNELDQRLEEMDIFVQDKNNNTDSKKQNLKEINRIKRMENRKLKEQAKNASQHLDDAGMKLKSKLFNTKFHPIISVDNEFLSVDDVLVSKLLLTLERQKQEQERKIKEMEMKITYCFKNSKQSLELRKSSSGRATGKSMTKSGYLKSNLKSKKNNLSLRRVQPIMDELHPFEDLQIPTDKNFENLDEGNQENQNDSESDEENEVGQENYGEKSQNFNGSNSQKIKIKKKKKEQEQNEKLDFEQMVERFQESTDCIVDLNRVNNVERQKQYNQQELALLSSQEMEQQNGLFYQEFWDIKQKDVQESKGVITAQASIEDVLLIADYTFYDQRFAKQMNSVMKALNYTKRETFIFLPGVIGFLKVVQNHILYVVQSGYFEAAMNLAVAFNTVILALDGLVPDSSANLLSEFNLAFTILFTIELGLKVLGMGPKNYLSDTMNIFDALIVALSLVELFLLGGGGSGKSSLSAFRSVRIFRAFRVLRVTKLMRSLQFMGFLIKVLSNAFQSFMYIMILLILFIFIFMLLGMAFFGGALVNNPVRQNFDDIQSAFLVVFQVLTLENWNTIVWNYMIQPDLSAFITIPYLVAWIMIGNYVFLNLFLAILLENFEEEYKNDKAGLDTNIEIGQDSVMDNTTQAQTSTMKSTMKTKKHTVAQELENNGDPEVTQKKQMMQKFIYFVEPGMCQFSLYIFSQDNLLRRICYRIVKDNNFETLIFFMIFLTSTKLVFDTYISDTGQLKEISLQIDIFFATFFATEMIMKIIAFGFVQQDSSYLRESWNILDFFIVIASMIDVSVSTINLSFVKILRLLRTLRPLRFITHNRSMKILVSALLQSINGIFNVAIVVVLVWMMFAILGINLQKNKMHYCDMGDDETYYHYDAETCVYKGGVWANYRTNFDNILNGMLTLFILSTMEGWPDYMYLFIDADESGPIKNAQTQFSWFFVCFILIGSILLINLFIGVILVNYHLAEEASRDKILTQPQVDWIELQKLIVQSNPNLAMFFCPDNPVRARIFKIIKHKFFDPTILMIIVCNIVTMAISLDDGPITLSDVTQQMNTAFTVIFITEATLKIIALGPVGYMRNSWNQFDFFVVLASILDLILQFTGNSFISFLSAGPQLARVFRVLRVTRLFRLIKSFEGLQKLIETAIYSLPAMLNVTALLFLVYFIFAILGVFLFGSINSGWVINADNNFSDFHHSFELLFRCSTGEDWYKIMFDTMGGGQGYYCIYWIVFIVIQQYIMLNLFILIILDQYEINYFNSDNPLNKFQEYENMFIESWSKYAKEDKGMKMHCQLLVPLLLDMEKPVGYDLKQKIEDDISEWRKINPQLDTKENVQKQIQIITAASKKVVSTAIMKMNIYADSLGFVKYHQILFSVMKSFMWKKVSINLTPEGAEKILLKEDETQKKLKRKQVGPQSKEVTLVNPIVQFLFVSMAFKALKRFGEKKKQQKLLQAQILLEQEMEHFSDGFSSDSSFDNKIEILSRISKETDHPKRPDYGRTKYLTLPNTEVYKEEIYINQETPNQNNSDRSSREDEDEEPDQDVMQQYTKDFKKNLIKDGSAGNIQDDKSSNTNQGGQTRTSQMMKQPKRTTLRPGDIVQGLASKKSIQSNSNTLANNPNHSQLDIQEANNNSNSNK